MRYLFALAHLLAATLSAFGGEFSIAPAGQFSITPAVVVAPVASDPSAACVSVWWGRFGGSGTCIASEGGRSLVLTNNHIFSETYAADGGFARARYPLNGSVVCGGKTYPAVAIDGVSSYEGDLALMVVSGALPVAEMADAIPPLGSIVWHRGIGSGGGSGVLLANPRGINSLSSHFTSTAPSISGDSGAGLFHNGRLVGVNCGRHGRSHGETQRGTPIATIRGFVRDKAAGWLDRIRETPAPKAKAPPPRETPKAFEVKPAAPVVTWSERMHPDTTGRMCRWSWPSDPAAKPVFLGYCNGFK